MNAELNKIHYLVIGIGININTTEEEIPEDIKDKASSLRIEKDINFNRKVIMASILSHFEVLYKNFIATGSVAASIDICREYSAVIDKEILLIEGNNTKTAKALDINSNGHLVVEDESGIREVLSGEVSIRTANGYI
jgi:Biotin-(acetyl-CoA carboxylase) ligase